MPHVLSPLRYVGGKGWLAADVARWATGSRVLVEPFAGGAAVALRCVLAGAVERAVLVEREPGVAAFWQVVTGPANAGFDRMCDLVRRVEPTRAWFGRFMAGVDQDAPAWLRAAAALLRSRFAWGGVQRSDAGLTSDAGLAERWCPDTLLRRMARIRAERRRFSVVEGDGVQAIREWEGREDAFFFVDPPYSCGEAAPGDRLYDCHDLDHDALLAAVVTARARAVITYDLTEETLALAARHGLVARPLPMLDGRHRRRQELLLLKGTPGQP